MLQRLRVKSIVVFRLWMLGSLGYCCICKHKNHALVHSLYRLRLVDIFLHLIVHPDIGEPADR
jgi:hypothetical protein